MRIHRLTLRDFRGVADRTILPGETGVTIVQGDNEAGKTSIVEALDLLLDYRDDSQAAAVRAVKPVDADVGAFVEAELSAGPYRFTYAKRFHRDRSTTLHVTQPAPEHHTGREAHQRVGAILDEHVDRQLWAALRLHQGVELDQADLSEGTSLAAALDGAASAGIGGDRESTVFDRVRAEHERYFTARAGRPTKLLTDAADAEEAARDEADRLSTELDRLDADIERDAALARAIEERRAALAEQRRRAEALDAEAALLARRAAEVERLRLESELADAARDRAARDVAARAALVAEVDAAAEAATAARERLDAARTAQRDAEDRRETLLLHDQLALLSDRLARARAAQDDLSAADAALAEHDVDDDALAAVEAAEREHAAAEAALAADAAVVEVRALADVPVAVDGEDPQTVAAGATLSRRAADRLVVAIGEVAEVVVTGGGSARLRAERHAEARDGLAAACAAAGVADPDAARRAHRLRREAARAAQAARALLDAALAGATTDLLADRIDRLTARIGDVPRGAVDDADAAEDAVRDARKRLAEAEGGTEDARHAQRTADDALATRRAEVEDARREAGAAARRHATATADLAAARERDGDRALATALAEQEARAATAVAEYGRAATALRDVAPERARADADHAAAVATRLAEELRSAEDERRDVRARLELRGDQGLHDAFEAARRTHEHARREHRRLRAQAAAAKLLHDRMAAHRDAARRAYAAPFREKLERLARIVFGDSLAVELDDDLRIARRTLGGVTLDYDQLSSGAREQLAVLARLAVAGIVGRDGGVPLILDDALGYSDPTRLERLGAALRVGARETQVIVLTCVPERYRHVGEATVVRL